MADVLGPLVGKHRYVKNSKHLADELKDVVIDLEHMLCSHDVVSVFTNTLISRAIEVFRKRLENGETLKQHTPLNVDIIELLELVLSTTYFSFRGQLYQQKFGLVMDSPVSLIINIFMEDM